MELLFWIFCNTFAIVGCDALPVDLNGGSGELPSKSLIIMVVVATLLGILSFMAIIAYWNASLCRARPTDVTSTGSAGSPSRSANANRRHGRHWSFGNGKVSAATASPSSMGRQVSSTRSAPSAPIRHALPIPKQALKSKLAAPVVGAR